ncbi:MAG: CpcT/CpeT family chromophore lyase [Cyanobacteriota bacterium]|jgi:hypothetical protein
MTPPAPQPFAAEQPRGMEAVETVARLWQGSFDNARQVEATLARGGPPAPELTREHRALEVVRLEAPQLGDVVLYFQECRATVPGRAHRQRVTRLVVAEGGVGVRAEQLFFREGPTYDRPLLPPEQVAVLGEEAFTRYPGCDVVFHFEPQLNRWRGAMVPGACRYQHPEDGEVCAEFAMLLSEDQLWYRDRALRLRDGGIRGEIDGFSWLLFDRRDGPPPMPLAAQGGLEELVARGLPALARQMGVWEGTFRRYDADGHLVESFSSTVVQRLEAKGGRWLYSQTNLYHLADGGQRRIEATGELLHGRLHVTSDRLQGWAMDLPHAPDTTVLLMESADGSNRRVREISQVLDGGRRRFRSFQAVQDGRIVGRTHIDEHKRDDDWRAWSPPPPNTDG